MPSLELVPVLDLIENDALLQLVHDPVYASALKKFFARHEQYFKDKVTSTENQVPETLDQEMKKRTQVAQFAAQARMWATAWAELEMYVSSIEV
jgi:hypothetical protein